MKKRVLQFIGSFHQGGSERQAVSLTRLLKDNGNFDVYLATLNSEGILGDEVNEIGLPEIPQFRLTSFYNANFVTQIRRCTQYLRENRIDIVHTHDFYTNVFGMAAATLAKVPVRIASKRETGGMRSGTQEFVEKLAFRQATAIVANSQSVREYLIKRGVNNTKIEVIYNGIDLTRFTDLPTSRAETLRKIGLPTGDNIRFITLVANLRHHVKNVPMLLRAAKHVTAMTENVHFVIAGEGNLENELKTLAAELGVAESVHFIGRCTDIPRLLYASYACVLTSTAEGFSNSILEYKAAGKPVVATNVGGASEVIENDVNGYLISPNDDADLAAKLVALLDDEDLAAAMGDNGASIVRHKFSNSSLTVQICNLYETLLQSI